MWERWRVLGEGRLDPTWELLKWVATKVRVGARELLPNCDWHLRPSTRGDPIDPESGKSESERDEQIDRCRNYRHHARRLRRHSPVYGARGVAPRTRRNG